MYYIAEITVIVDDAGTRQTLLFGNFDHTTRHTDTPAHQRVWPRLVQPGNFSVMLDPDLPFGVPQTGYGVASLLNHDRQFDHLARAGVGWQRYTLRAKATPGGAYPADWTVVRRATMDRVEPNGRRLDFFLRDEMQATLRRPMCSIFAGTGGLQGVAPLTGQAMPRVYGAPFNIKPTLLNGNDIYLLSDKPYTFASYSGDGRGVIANSAAGFNQAASFAALTALAVPRGQVARCADHSLVKLGSPPSFQLGCDVSRMSAGYPGGEYERVQLGQVLTDMALDSGVEAARIDPGVGGLLGACSFFAADTSTTYQEAMDAVARGVCAYAYFDRLNVLQAGLWSAPAGAPVATFRPVDSKRESLTFRQRVPCARVRAHAARNWSTLARERVTNALVGSAAGWEQIKWIADEYAGLTVVGSVPARFPNARDLDTYETGYHNNVMGNSLPNVRSASHAATVAALLGVPRDIVSITQPIDLARLAAVRIGSVVRVQWPAWGLDAGKLFRVFGVAEEHARNEATYHLWA